MATQGSQVTPAASSGSTAEQAATGFYTAAAARFTAGEAGAPDPNVSVAFALGWQMAEVLHPDRRGPVQGNDDLPGVASLTAAEVQTMGLLQLQAGITKLHTAFTAAGLQPPDPQAFAGQLPGVTDATGRLRTIRDFHVKLLTRLTAADFRLGKAYGLGWALADTSRGAPDPARELRAERVATLAQWTRELASALPAHAAHPVADSLEAWSRWVQDGGHNPETVAKLGAQGKLWRGLLSGEKHATDMLETMDYLRAGEGMLQRSASLALKFLRHYWQLVLLVLVLFAVGVALVATSGNAAAVATGAASILASFGLSWKGVGSSLGTATGRLEQPLWGAELDIVVYQRITPSVIVASQQGRVRDREEASLVAAGKRFEARGRTSPEADGAAATQAPTPAQARTTVDPPADRGSGTATATNPPAAGASTVTAPPAAAPAAGSATSTATPAEPPAAVRPPEDPPPGDQAG